MRSVAVANQKGGVGKTTITISLAGAVAQAGGTVLVVDADPQGHATVGLGRAGLYYGEGGPTLASCLTGDTPDAGLAGLLDIAVYDPPGPGRVDLIPSTPDLFLTEARLVAERGREHRLARLLAAADSAGYHDLLLIDCPPSLGTLTDNALIAAREVMIVAGADPASRHGLELLVGQIRSLRDALGIDVTIAGLVVNRVEATRIARDTMDTFAELGLPLLGSVPKRTRLQEAWAARQPIQAYDPTAQLVATFTELAEALDVLPTGANP
jgi:chromosome partitioning protein